MKRKVRINPQAALQRLLMFAYLIHLGDQEFAFSGTGGMFCFIGKTSHSHSERAVVYCIPGRNYAAELVDLFFCGKVHNSTEQKPVCRSKDPDLDTKGKYPVDWHFADPRCHQLCKTPMEMDHIYNIAVKAHNWAHHEYCKAGPDTLIKDLIVGRIFRRLPACKLLHEKKLQQESRNRFLHKCNPNLAEKLTRKGSINQIFVE
ncbi:MAG: hypothetical protein ACI3W5_11050 [Faecousia sp.]